MTVSHAVDFGLYLSDDEENTILLPKKWVANNVNMGDKIEVFVYNDSEDRPIATTMTPKATVGEIVCLDVVDVNLIGAFLDWGLEKDLLLPFKHQFRDLKPGDKCLVKVIYDAVSDRIIATTKIMFTYDEEKDNLNVGDKVSIQVSDIFARETRVLVNGVYYGNIFKSEIYKELTVGEKLTGYLNKFRYDGKLDIILKPIGIKAVLDDKGIIINHLKESEDGFLPFNSKSSSDEIRDEFKMSKKAFKKALGGLYKSRRITVTDDGMKLNK